MLSAPGRRARSIRLVLCALAAALALLSWLDYRSWDAEQRRLYQLLDDAGVLARRPQAARELRRLLDPERAKVLAARQLLAGEQDRAWLLDLPEESRQEEIRRGPDRLQSAALLAAEAAARRPASWAARMVKGAAVFLDWSRRGDLRLGTQRWRWEEPLRAALRLAPAQPEPARFLAAAYLSEWSRLPPGKRREATALLARAFEDRETLFLLVGSWLRLAPSLEVALSVVPDRLSTWERLQQEFAARQDWERYGLVRQRWWEARQALLEEALASAETRRRGGDASRARHYLLAVTDLAMPSLCHARPIQRVLERLPSDLVAPHYQRRFQDWLGWTLDRCTYDECPFAPATIERLALLAQPQSPLHRAQAALACGRLADAEALEDPGGEQLGTGWAPYWLLKARVAAARGQAAEARSYLARGRSDGARHWLVARAVAEETEDNELLATAVRQLQQLSRSGWSASDWEPRGSAQELEMLLDRDVDGFELDFRVVDPAGAVVDLSLDGEILGAFAVTPGDRIAIQRPLSRGLHKLTLVKWAGRAVSPGSVRLRAAV